MRVQGRYYGKSPTISRTTFREHLFNSMSDVAVGKEGKSGCFRNLSDAFALLTYDGD
jgi:hypothetical protein